MRFTNSYLFLQKLPIRHTLDVMHIERNLFANILRHLFGEANTPTVWKDMQDVGQMRHLWLREQLGSRLFAQPHAPYVFIEFEKRDFFETVAATCVQNGYSATLQKHVGDGKLIALKTHNHHVLLQQILPASIKNSILPRPWDAIIRIGTCFNAFA